MKLGILQTDYVRSELAPAYGEYPDMFARLLHQVEPELELIPYDVIALEYPKDIDAVDAYLITGSVHSVYEDLPWIQQLGAFVRELQQKEKKLVGICFGHQLIAHFFGGKTEASPKGWGIGVHSYDLHEAGRAFTQATGSFRIVASHKDQVVLPAEGSEILASSDFCPVAMCTIGPSIFTIQGHPEFEEEYARELLHLRRSKFEASFFERNIATMTGTNDSVLVAEWIINFLKSN